MLQGAVPDLREAARDGRVEVTFRDSVMEFTVALGSSAELIRVEEEVTFNGERRALLRLRDGADQAEWLHWISGHVQLTSCAPWQPGMREIFIQAVDHQLKDKS